MRKVFFAFCLLTASAGFAQKFNGLAPTPPMGWNSWNKFDCNVNEKVIREAADAFVSTGMKDAGYQYIVIDDCWQVGRDSLGNIVVDAERFPSGIKALADYVHGRGLKFGVYTCAGRATCQMRPGSRGHEYQDAVMYAKWGVDYLKEDWCNSEGQDAKESYTLMRDALYAAKRPIVFSLCEWGTAKPWEWAAPVGNLWRTCGDIGNSWDEMWGGEGRIYGGSVLTNLAMQEGLDKYAGPGHWNDPDMLEVGNGVLTDNESRAHFSLWCMLAAPLMAGNDLSAMTPVTKAILTNKNLIAIDQDSLGKQGRKVRDFGEFEIYYKELSQGDVAICLFNRFRDPLRVTLDWKELTAKFSMNKKPLDLKAGVSPALMHLEGDWTIFDCWKNASVGTNDKPFTAEIPGHDVVVLRFHKIR